MSYNFTFTVDSIISLEDKLANIPYRIWDYFHYFSNLVDLMLLYVFLWLYVILSTYVAFRWIGVGIEKAVGMFVRLLSYSEALYYASILREAVAL